MTIGQRIKDARTYKGMTMEELGKIIGVRRATISRYESGEIGVNSPKIEAIAAALDVTPGYLMGWTDHPGQMDILDMAGASPADRSAAYAQSMGQAARKFEKRQALERLVNSATEEEIELITQLVQAVIKNRK